MFKPTTVLLLIVTLKDVVGLKDCGLWYCEEGYDCCGYNKCIPEGTECCGVGYYCENGLTCCGPFICCSAGYYCDGSRCAAGRKTDLTTKRATMETTTRWTRWTYRWTSRFTTWKTDTHTASFSGSSKEVPFYVFCFIPLGVFAIMVCILILICRRASRRNARRMNATAATVYNDVPLTAYNQGQTVAMVNNSYEMVIPSATYPYTVENGGNTAGNISNSNNAFSQPPPAYDEVVKTERY